MAKKIKKIWNGITTILVTCVVIFAILFAGARVFGFKVLTVLSGSMEPAYKTGALIYVKDADTKELQPGDVITFLASEETIVTHRIVEVVPGEEGTADYYFRTKGDANQIEDASLIHPQNVLGTPVFSIPYLGYLAAYIQNPPGSYIAIAASAMIILMVILPDLIFDEKESKKKESEEEPAEASEVEDNEDDE